MFFYIVGWATTVLGLAWAFVVAREFAGSADMNALGKILALAPSMGAVATGLLFVGFAAVLHRLDKMLAD